MFVWCYASISLHAGDLWQILQVPVINLWVKISMLDSDGQIVLFVCVSVYLVHIMVDYSQVHSIIKYPKL